MEVLSSVLGPSVQRGWWTHVVHKVRIKTPKSISVVKYLSIFITEMSITSFIYLQSKEVKITVEMNVQIIIHNL